AFPRSCNRSARGGSPRSSSGGRLSSWPWRLDKSCVRHCRADLGFCRIAAGNNRQPHLIGAKPEERAGILRRCGRWLTEERLVQGRQLVVDVARRIERAL